MQFEIMRDRLLDSVNTVIKAISSKVTTPILTGIKIEATNEGLTMTGSDSDITISTFIPLEEDGTQIIRMIQPGTIVLQAKVFSEIIRKLPTNDVMIELREGTKTHIRSGQSEFHIIAQSADEYPILPDIQEAERFELPADLMKSIIRETVFAVSQQETRPVLTGVQWMTKEQELYCIATDSHRLARRIITPESQASNPFNVVIPGKGLQELSRILPDASTPVEIYITNQQVLFKLHHVLFYSRLLEGNYPDTSRLIPDEYKTSITINGRNLLQAIDRASLLSRDDRNNIVHFTTDGNSHVQISSNSPDIGNVEELVAAGKIEGEPLKISFSSKYMMDALKAIDSQEVTIHFTGSMRPFVLKSLNSEAILQLILPVRTI